MARKVDGVFLHSAVLSDVGLTHKMFEAALADTYELLDRIDSTLVAAGAFPMSQTVELANLSSMIGNMFGAAIAKNSDDLLCRNGPHKYPDLLSTGKNGIVPNIEIKMALERNQPKGHLAKAGYYISARYVLCTDEKPIWEKSARGVTPYIWEIRFGLLSEDHFNISNTAGDSGKTAVVNKAGMEQLKVIYLDLHRAPIPPGGRTYKAYLELKDSAT